MKKSIIFLLFICLQSYGQFGWQKVYENLTYGFNAFSHYKFNGETKKTIYVQYGYYGNYPSSQSSRIWRFNKQTNTINTTANGFLNERWCFCFCTFSCNPPVYVILHLYNFEVSISDSNFIFKNQVGSCGCDAGDMVGRTVDNGFTITNYPQFSNDFAGRQCRGYDIDPLNDSINYISYFRPGGANSLFRSSNRGKTWIAVDTANFSIGFVKINPMRRSNIFATGGSGLMLSTNSGSDFFNVGNVNLSRLVFDHVDSSIYGYGFAGIFKSSNHGLNWLQILSGSNYIRAVEVSPDNHTTVFAGGDSGIYRSTNSGFSWSLYNNSFYPSKRVIGLSKDPGSGDTIYAVTNDGIYKCWAGYVLTGITYTSNEIPEKFELHQNYPNPFNPVTKIKFQIPQSETSQRDIYTKLLIYDVLGKEVQILVNQQLSPGTYEVDFDGRNLPSGVYYYKLVVGDPKGTYNTNNRGFVETKRMVLIK